MAWGYRRSYTRRINWSAIKLAKWKRTIKWIVIAVAIFAIWKNKDKFMSKKIGNIGKDNYKGVK